ncbi:hypothetical protein [Devosia ginsengisoli]|uniref:hypothetical protein n=1 Tax=Devosia ginsengisoli TaxID=400770 RepID=UPI0026F26D93|nr:hypothetical protein [Devosia ginsengisoli]MCR6669801.1 hypothetical protein [Devosia ginsengisoli]
MVFGAAVLLKWRSILDNVLLPAELTRQGSRAQYHQRALELLRLVGLEDFAEKRPSELACRAACSSARSAALCCSIHHSCSWMSPSALSTP